MAVGKEKLMYVGGTILALGTGIASTIGAQLLSGGVQGLDPGLLLNAGLTAGGGVAVNLLSNTAQTICNGLKKKVITPYPNELNHNLQKSLLTAVDRALANTLVLYRDTKPKKRDIVAAGNYMNGIRPALKNLFKTPVSQDGYNEHIRKYIHAAVDEANGEILQSLRLELESAVVPPGFITLFSETFTDQLRLCFSEELKDDSRSWVAFQKMMLEAAKSDLESLIAGQKRIETELRDIREAQLNSKLHRLSPRGAEAVAKLIEEINQPERIQLQLDRALDDLLNEVKRDLKEVKQLTEATHTEVVNLKKAYERDRVDWWSRKMIVAYGLTVLLAVVILWGYRHYSGQPFMVTVAVHGPGGIGDAVLQGKVTAAIAPGGHAQQEILDDKGRAFFKRIPGEYRGDSVEVVLSGLEGEPYRPVVSGFRLEKDAVFYVPLAAVGLDKIQGIVVNEQRKPVADAVVLVQDIEARTDANGLFTLTLPTEKQRRLQDISIVKSGYKQETVHQVAPHVQTRPLEIMLFKD
jgi:hypothetical protein